MFNKKFNPQDPQYLFDITRYYKIWFSTNPDSYLGVEDQLRFIEMRQNNPTATLSFIYSSTCLSPTAIQELNQFCVQHKITPVEFESLKSEMQQPQDQKLYACAETEIQKALAGTGGNMAAASDCTRLLTPVIEKYGIYSDFDVRVSLTQINAERLLLRGPVLFPSECTTISRCAMLMLNTDFLAFSLNTEIPAQLSDESLRSLGHVRDNIIKRYKEPFSWSTFSPDAKINQMVNSSEIQSVMDNFHRLYPDNSTIFNFRQYLISLSEIKPNDLSVFTLSSLMKLSVICVTGPVLFNYLYQDIFPEGISIPPLLVPIQAKWLPFLALYERSNIGFYQPIAALIESKNSFSAGVESAFNDEKKERQCDNAWLPQGMAAKKAREEKIQESASILQRACRRYFLWKQEHPLLNEVLKVCHDKAILDPLRMNNFELALRRASFGLRHEVVELIVKHKLEHQLELNINSQSETNPKTALDWAKNAKPKTQTEKKAQNTIIQILKQAGALTAAELQENTFQQENAFQ